jgi:pimeloyl-ACP methyl ester carboxylesterase
MTDLNALSFASFHPGKEKTIVFLHGGGAAGWMWQPVVERLVEYHCLVPDLPEHGLSAFVKPFTMLLAAEKCAELIHDQAHGKKAVVVGLSEGAQTAVQLFATAPEVMEKAFISSALLLPAPGAKMVSSPGLIGAMFRLSVPPFRNNELWIRLNMKYAAGVPEEFYPQFEHEFQNMTESQFVNLIIANQAYRMPAGLEQVQVPALVVCGKHEYKCMQQSAQLLASTLPNNQQFTVDLGKGSTLAREHNWAMTAPEEFSVGVKNWLTEKEMPGVMTLVLK